MKVSIGKVAIAVLVVAVAAFGVVQVRGSSGYTQLMQKRDEVKSLEQENSRLRADIQRLEKRVDKLKRDPEAQEFEVRKRLKMLKPGEVTYVLQDKTATPAK